MGNTVVLDGEIDLLLPLDGEMGIVTEIGGGGGGSTLIEKTVNANGVYNASSDSADGYSKVTVSVPASAVDTGTKSISTNGTHDVVGYASANVSVPASAVDTGTKSITANGTNQDVVGYAAVDVNVPNTYTAGDEGKVVSNGALVSQTSDTVTTNDTYDTTLISSLTVNVSGGGGLVYEEGTYTAAANSNPTISFANAHASVPAMVMLVDASGSFPDSTNKGVVCMFGNLDALVTGGVADGDSTYKDGVHGAIFRGSSTTLASAGGIRSPISNNVTASGFAPFFGATTRTLISGRTYKWLAVWR